jgi:hypothetical protein
VLYVGASTGVHPHTHAAQVITKQVVIQNGTVFLADDCTTRLRRSGCSA